MKLLAALLVSLAVTAPLFAAAGRLRKAAKASKEAKPPSASGTARRSAAKRTAAVVVVAMLLPAVLAGCLGDGKGGGKRVSADDDEPFSGELPETSEEAEISAKEGAITGYVMSEQFTPITGANVTITELDRTTRAALDGSYTFSLIKPGAYKLTAQAFGWKPQAQSVQVSAGAVSRVSFQLEEIPGVHPYHEIFEFTAFLECGTGFALTQKPELEPLRKPANDVADAVEPVPLFGLDGFVDRYVRLLPEEWNETQGIGLLANTCAIIGGTSVTESYSNDAFIFNWSHDDPTIREIVLEMDWRPAPQAAKEFSVTVEPMVPEEECAETCDGGDDGMFGYYNLGYTYVRARGGPPLRATIDLEDLERVTKQFNENETKAGAEEGETATGFPVMKPQNFTQKASFVIRIFAVANEMGEGYPADYALSFQQPAKLYISQFFVKPPDEGYTAVPE